MSLETARVLGGWQPCWAATPKDNGVHGKAVDVRYAVSQAKQCCWQVHRLVLVTCLIVYWIRKATYSHDARCLQLRLCVLVSWTLWN